LILGGFNGDSMWSEWGDNEDENETEGSWMDEADDVRAFEEVKWHFFSVGLAYLSSCASIRFLLFPTSSEPMRPDDIIANIREIGITVDSAATPSHRSHRVPLLSLIPLVHSLVINQYGYCYK
jgi:hypothetical protein